MTIPYVPMLGVRQGLYKKRAAARAIIVHTTGSGPVRRIQDPRYAQWRTKHGISDPFEAALWIYRFAHNAGGHYLIGQEGQLVQTAPEDLAVWQVGSSRSLRYKTPHWCTRREAWWKERWPELESPLELAGGKLWEPDPRWPGRLSCNANSVGIEVVPRLDAPQGAWTDDAWRTLARLISDISSRLGIPVREDTVVSHSDAHPIRRSSHNGLPWDPWPAQWSFEKLQSYLKS